MKGARAAAIFCALLFLHANARANPWLKQEGDTELISNLEVSREPTGLGKAASARATSALHLEYGYRSNTTFVADADAQQYSWDGTGKMRFNNARAGMRVVLARWDNSILSSEGVAGVLAVREGAMPDSAISIYGTAEARLMFGQGFEILGRHGFGGIEAGWRWRPGPPADEAVLDAIAGIAPWSGALLMLQSFSILGTGEAKGAYSRYSLSKVEFSLAQELTDHISVQAGLIYQVAGREAGAPGLVLALWWRVPAPALSPVIF